MEINWMFLVSAIYCGLGVIVVAVGLFLAGSPEAKRSFEERLNDHPVRMSIITLVIMIMMVIVWLPYLIWAVINGWNKPEYKENKNDLS